MNKIHIIGIGYKPLDKRTREIILNSSIILASKRLAEVFKGYEEYEPVKAKVKVINNVDETIDYIRAYIQNTPLNPPLSKGGHGGVVLLASGDPAFFGIGRRAVREFGKDMVEIHPDLSCIQIAFARIKESWDDTFLMSLHGGPDPEKRRRLPYDLEDIPSLLQKYPEIAILTDKENNPSEIAKVLSLSPIAYSLLPVMYVCEKLGYSDEKITEGSPEKIAGMTFSEPNVVIIQNIFPPTYPSPPRGEGKGEGESLGSGIRFGLKENEFLHSRGLITKDEVRAVAIHKLRLPQKGVFWDIGAGSGSVSIETARLYPELKVFAVEKDAEQVKNIKENRIKFSASNIEIIRGSAPDVLINLPSPDRVFIGGSGGGVDKIISIITGKLLAGIIVVNAATVETLNIAIVELQRNSFLVDVSQISVSRMKKIGEGNCFSALNPVFVIRGENR
ncbi:MAG: precorrin-6y C5,15-methyltransferase (decarboxylating) subunit CbiE [Thermodesulfovibrionales bacterium]|nr:precorrin-6y C5,15-methyltransferase (decarboxylating) subunit CbiE [Thermodesulfovibrionales bacterium]